MRRALLALTCLALALRAYPLHVFFQHPDQELIPTMAVVSLVDGTWRPPVHTYPPGLLYTLRVLYLAGYGAGRALGAFRDRLDVLGSFLADPFPFLLAARVWACLLGTLTVPLTAMAGARAFGRRAGLFAGAFLALLFLHVRESHYGTLDAPATFFVAAMLVCAERYRHTGERRALVGTGVCLALGVAHRYQLLAMAGVLPVLVVLRPRPTVRAALQGVALAGAACVATLALVSPFTFLEWARVWTDLVAAQRLAYTAAFAGMPLPGLFGAAAGPGLCAAAVVGLVVGLWVAPRPTVLLLAAVAPSLAGLATAHRIFARYLLPLLPVLVILAANGIVVVGGWLSPRRARPVAIVLGLAVLVDPAVRTLQLDRLLATEDTRVSAGRFIREHLAPGVPILVPTAPAYMLPVLPMPDGMMAMWFGVERAQELARRGRIGPDAHPFLRYGLDGSAVGRVWQPGGLLLTMEHPLRAFFDGMSPALVRAVSGHARVLAVFPGVDPARAAEAEFEAIDANAIPLRGMGAIMHPGPTITVYQLGTLDYPGPQR